MPANTRSRGAPRAAAAKPVALRATSPRWPLRFGFLIHDVSRLRRTVFDQRLKPLGITRSQWWVLSQLSRTRGAPMSQVELARLLDVGKATLGGLIDRLERAGYVERVAGSDDRRVKQVRMTDEGIRLLAVIEKTGLALTSETTAGISADELRAFEDVLDRMKKNLTGLAER